MENSNNVIIFPKPPKPTPNDVTSKEDVEAYVYGMKHYHVEEAIMNVAPTIFRDLELLGFEVSSESDEGFKEGAFIVEALRAVMYKRYGMYHPFQQVIENIFTESITEEGSLQIVNSIKLDNLTYDEESKAN